MKFIRKIINWARIKSPWILHFNSGACNACDIEIVAALTPLYDVERFGIQLKGTPRHADVLVCSGPVTKQIQDRLKRIYDQMPEPKFVVAVGACACGGGVFKGCYNVRGGIDEVIPVSAYIPGCPAGPKAIIDGVVKLLTSLEEAGKPPVPGAKKQDKTEDGAGTDEQANSGDAL
ncbi:NADH-quinone oxidoreductase subunit B family protein [Candidatus Velamenicoccus archaeovorus]|uniref:NADH-quinone oxidoreductase subunit B family protein n=1 Tax=Velamenicoccus archaeovorus TaxID=1930593 RepID=UPI000FFE430E|nr:NADH-quinone oxidoreductase subunit B family protein [Candidatus Velamenicoccus archaeovorus]